MNANTAEESQLLQQQTRMVWRFVGTCGAAAAALAFVASRNGTALGLHVRTALLLPFLVGLVAFGGYLMRQAVVTGLMLTRVGVVKRSTRPRAFSFCVGVLALMLCALTLLAVVVIYLDVAESHGG